MKRRVVEKRLARWGEMKVMQERSSEDVPKLRHRMVTSFSDCVTRLLPEEPKTRQY